MNNKESSKLKLNDIKEIMNDINDEVIGFYEGNSDKEDNLHGIPGFNSRDEFIKDLVIGLNETWIEYYKK